VLLIENLKYEDKIEMFDCINDRLIYIKKMEIILCYTIYNEGFAGGYLVESVSSSISSASLIRGKGIKIGKTKKDRYGIATLLYGDERGGTLINISDKNGNSKFRIDYDKKNGAHLHYKTQTHGIGREDTEAYKKACGVIFGVVSRIFNFFK